MCWMGAWFSLKRRSWLVEDGHQRVCWTQKRCPPCRGFARAAHLWVSTHLPFSFGNGFTSPWHYSISSVLNSQSLGSFFPSSFPDISVMLVGRAFCPPTCPPCFISAELGHMLVSITAVVNSLFAKAETRASSRLLPRPLPCEALLRRGTDRMVIHELPL